MSAPVLAAVLLMAGHSSAAELRPPLESAVAEASAAFAIPSPWIRGVMARESGGDPRAVSPAGALGLMQLMPATWREQRARYALGSDPFDVRDNVYAGAAYLREMLDRFGPSGFLAAYNAGPARYTAFRSGRAGLPRETRAYVAALAPLMGAAPAGGPLASHRRLTPNASSLFPPLDGVGS